MAGNQIERLRRARDLSQEDLADQVGISPGYLSRIEREERPGSRKVIEKIAQALNCGVGDLIDGNNLHGTNVTESAGGPSQGRERRLEYEKMNAALPSFGRRDVPVRGAAAGAMRGDFVMSNEPVDYAYRPAHLANLKNLYGIFVINDSMSPEYHSGVCVLVNPDKPARPGDIVVVQLKGEKGETEALFKRLKKVDDKTVVLEQINPAMERKFARADVLTIHRVLPWNEVLGV